MEPIVIKDIPFTVDRPLLFRRIGIKPGTGFDEEVESLAARAEAIGRPKAIYRESFVEARGEAGVTVDGVSFESRVLAENFKEAHRVFPYVLTCGTELEAWSDGMGDPVAQLWAETISELALQAASVLFMKRLEEAHGLTKSSRMNPGSLPDWPLPQQAPLFRLLGDVEGTVGVRLSESFLMMPKKSVSGIQFPTESGFVNCQLCPREGCPGRKAPHRK